MADTAAVSDEQIETILRDIVTVEALETLSKRSARHELERKLGLQEDALKSRRENINAILSKIVEELRTDEQDEASHTEAEEAGGGGGGEEQATGDGGGNSGENGEHAGGRNDETKSKTNTNGVQSGNESESSSSSSSSRSSSSSSSSDEEEKGNEKQKEKEKKQNAKRTAPSTSSSKSSTNPPKNLKKIQSSAMSKAAFLELASSMKCQIGAEVKFDMAPRKFGPGSCGWYYGGKIPLFVGKKEVWCQLGVNCTVLGSKEWPETSKKRKK